MSLYSRSDLMSVSIPSASGCCGKTHSRPVVKGVPSKVWKLTCPPCESYLKGDNKQKVIKVRGGDKNAGIPSRMDHVADSDPHWATSPEAIPLTPDEESITLRRQEVATQQLQLLQASAAAKAAGFDIPSEAAWLLEEKLGNLLQGNVVCLDGHDNPAGVKFCGECGVSMKARAAIKADDSDDVLAKLDVRTLKEMCRAEKLPVSGTKAQLIERLS